MSHRTNNRKRKIMQITSPDTPSSPASPHLHPQMMSPSQFLSPTHHHNNKSPHIDTPIPSQRHHASSPSHDTSSDSSSTSSTSTMLIHSPIAPQDSNLFERYNRQYRDDDDDESHGECREHEKHAEEQHDPGSLPTVSSSSTPLISPHHTSELLDAFTLDASQHHDTPPHFPYASHQTHHRKILYEPQPYPDNYTGPSFLADVIENENIIPYDYWMCVQETGAVTQQISLVGIYGCCFLYLQRDMISVWIACVCILSLLMLGYWLLYAMGDRQFVDMFHMLKHLGRSSLIVVILFGLAPILRTLTIEYSSDTIIALVVALLIVHLYTHDYAFMNGYNSTFSCSLSLNSIFFVSILCASQLRTSLHSFAIVSLAILLFALFPVLRHHLRVSMKFKVAEKSLPEYESFSYDMMTLLLCTTTFLMTWYFSKFLAGVFASTVFFISFIIPYWLIILQSNYKYHVSGPWDEPPQYFVVNMD